MSHVFVLHADIRQLACDAWLMPCDNRFQASAKWYEEIPGRPSGYHPHALQEETGSSRVRAVTALPAGMPRPWLVDVGRFPKSVETLTEAQAAWYAVGVGAFVAAAAPAAHRWPAMPRRQRPLLAIPIVGTGGGGAAKRVDQVLHAIFPTLYKAADAHDVDIALVAYSRPNYAAALHARDQLTGRFDVWPPSLTPDLQAHAHRLAAAARSGRLALFLGAGVSMAAGAPSWEELLGLLTDRAALDAEQRAALREVDFLDQASILEERLGQLGCDIKEEAAGIMRGYRRYALAHAFLATLPGRAVITQNYDALFEHASAGAGQSVAVLPYEPAATGRWLLKMHGCVEHPADIVLTRADYLRFDIRRAALRGIVQAMLMTRHMLFVGFSLRDDNFLRVVDDVRQAVRGSGTRAETAPPFGSALMLHPHPLLPALWKQDLHWIATGRSGDPTATAARELEIFLDYLAAHALDHAAYLLDDRYALLLTEDEVALKHWLLGLARDVADDPLAREAPAWKTVQRLLDQLGYRE